MRVKQYFTTRWALVALAFIAFGLRLYHIGFQSMWRDEVDAILFATGDWSSLLGMFTRPGENGPLYFLMLRPWLAVLGDSEFAARYSSLVWGVLAVPLTYHVGRKFLPPVTSFWSAVLVATSPYLIWYSQETKMYTLVVCLSLLSTWLLVEAVERNETSLWIGYIIITSLSFYTHILAVVILPFHVILFVTGGPRFWARWRSGLVALAFLTVPYIPLARWEIPTLLSTFETGHPFYPLNVILTTLFQVLSFGVREPASVEIGLFLFLLSTGTFLYRRSTNKKFAISTYPQVVFWLYMLIPVLTVFLISLGMPIFTDRYLIIIAPAFYLLLACGLEALRNRSRLIFGICLAGVLVANGQGFGIQSHTTIKADFRSAAAYYEANATPGDLLVIQMPYVHRNFEYYFRQPYRRADGLYTNRGMTFQQVAGEMEVLTAGHDTVWFLKSEAEMWDNRDLVETWLKSDMELVDRLDFQRVSLMRYVKNRGASD